MKNVSNSILAVSFFIFSTTSYACSYTTQSYQYGGYISEYTCTNNQNTVYGSSNSIYYGLGGDDTFIPRYGADRLIFVGGNGNDQYHTGENPLRPYQIQVLLEKMSCMPPILDFMVTEAFVATYHGGRHLIAGDTVTGAVIVWIDFKTA